VSTKYGRFQVAEPHAYLLCLHTHQGGPLNEVDHEPKVSVLDQEDLIAQGIDTSVLIKGAQKVDALGSCTANGFTAAWSNIADPGVWRALVQPASEQAFYTDTKAAEEFAIGFYHRCTDQTGSPAQEWPPTDCGSSGPYIVQEAVTEKLIAGCQIANTAQDIVSLMQTSGLVVGQPWFNSWEEPDANGFIDGDGSAAALEAALQSGVAGGHETFWSAIEHLALSATGQVVPEQTIIRGRNSWSANWGDHGSYRFHLSTYMAIASHCDFRALTPIGTP